MRVAEGGGDAAGFGGGASNDGATKAGISGHATGERAIAMPSEWAVIPPRRCALKVAGTVSASATGAVPQHEAALTETGAEAFCDSMAHARQVAAAGGSPGEVAGIAIVIVIGQTSRSPARGAAPVTTRERRRRRLNWRRIMILQ